MMSKPGRSRLPGRLPEPADRAVDDVFADCPHGLVVDSETIHDARTEVLHDQVGVTGQAQEQLAAARALEIERDASLVAVRHRERVALAGDVRGQSTSVVASRKPLDLDDVGAQIREHHRAVGASEEAGQVENPKVVERTHKEFEMYPVSWDDAPRCRKLAHHFEHVKRGTVRRMSDVQSIDRAVAILRCFTPRTPLLGISGIARATGLSTSTTHRLLRSMEANRIVRQAADRRYALGPLLVQLVRSGAASTTLRDAALAAMTELRDSTDETVGVHELLPSDQRTVLDQVESHQPLRRTYTEIGVPIPLTHGAPGRILLAFLPEERREAILAKPIAAVTPATITDADEMRRQLEEDRRRHFAVSLAERTAGIRTVAAPIFDHRGAVVGCLSISGPEARMPEERLLALGPRVRDAAWSVAEVLGATDEVVQTQLAARPVVGAA